MKMNEDDFILLIIILFDIYLFIVIYLFRRLEINDCVGFRSKKSYVSRKNWEFFNKGFSRFYCNLFYLKYLLFLTFLLMKI